VLLLLLQLMMMMMMMWSALEIGKWRKGWSKKCEPGREGKRF